MTPPSSRDDGASDFATRRTAASIAELVTKHPGLGQDVFVHEHDYNQVFNTRRQLKSDLSTLRAENEAMRNALLDMLSGWKYIRSTHGDLYGVGWDRAQSKAEAALHPAQEVEERKP
jgi:hypothetical protein